MAEYTNGQMQCIMREMFNDGIDNMLSGVCQNKEQIEESMISLRALKSSNRIMEPIFWFNEKGHRFEEHYLRSYFIKDDGITRTTLMNWDSETPKIDRLEDTLLIERLQNREVTRDRAYLNTRLLCKHHSCILTLPEYLQNPNSSFWKERFYSREIETNVKHEDIYGKYPRSAGMIFNTFVNVISGKSLYQKTVSGEVRKELDDKLV